MTPTSSGHERRYDQLYRQIEHQDAYTIDHRVEEVLTGLGFGAAEFNRPAATFSGGQQSRLMLAKLLLESPDLMLLDEPSNHLDIATTEWLENYLARQPVAMVVVSHDRYFLDKVINKVWEMHFGRITVYPGNYTQYWRLRSEKAKVLERQAERQDEKAADLEAYIRKYGAGQRAKQAHDRERKLERLERERVDTLRDVVGPVMGFDEVERSGDIVIEARRLSKSFASPLFRDLSLTVGRGECVGVIGPNGAGKTTLIKTLIGREKADHGDSKLGHKVQVGYHDQGLRSLDPKTTVVRAVWPEDDPEWVEKDVRDLLARFGLKGDLAFQTVGQLSGGEKAKAALARLCATSANLLVMDEPTNHLDIWSREALERSINEFEGTVLVVTHDRYFLNQVVDRLVAMADGQARMIEGDYDTFQHMIAREKELALGTPSARAGGPASPHPQPRPGPGQDKDQAEVRLPEGRRDRARDRRAGARSRRAGRQARPALDIGATRSRPSTPRIAIAISKPSWKPCTSIGRPRWKRTGEKELLSAPQSLAADRRQPRHVTVPRARSMPDPRKVLSTIRRATDLFRSTPGRSGGIISLEDASDVMVVGDLHGNLPTFKKVLVASALEKHPTRHLVLQELIHGPASYPGDGGDRSHQLLDVVAALKCQYPYRAHLILGNHELSELTGRTIGKDGETLNAKFMHGITTAYGDAAPEIYDAYKALFAAPAAGYPHTESRLRLPHHSRRTRPGYARSRYPQGRLLA